MGCIVAAMAGCGSENRGRAGCMAAGGWAMLPPEVQPPRHPPKVWAPQPGARLEHPCVMVPARPKCLHVVHRMFF